MATVEERLTIEERLDALERVNARSGLRIAHGMWFPGSLQMVRPDKDGDGDFDPYTSTSWDGDSFSTSTGTINWNSDFGVPTSAKMVVLAVDVGDSGGEAGGIIRLRAKSSTTSYSLIARSRASDAVGSAYGPVAVAPNGTSYYSITASGTNTCDVWIKVVAYAR